MGHLLSITPHLDRVQAIKEMTSPQDVKGVQRFLGMCNYLSRFTPNLAEIVKPLTELTYGDAVWSRSSQHDKAFKTAKSLIANATTSKFFDVNKPCELQVDASDTGLGVASYADALWARHAIFLPHERLLKRMGCLIRPITAHFPIKAANFDP